MPSGSSSCTACTESRTAAATAVRVAVAAVGGQHLLQRQGPQPIQVHRIGEALQLDHRPGLGQRQRQVTQLLSHRLCAGVSGEAGTFRQVDDRVRWVKDVDLDFGARRSKRPVGAGNDHPRLAGCWQVATNDRRVGRIVDHEHARSDSRIEGITQPPGRRFRVPLGIRDSQPPSHLGQPEEQPLVVFARYPSHQLDAVRHRVRASSAATCVLPVPRPPHTTTTRPPASKTSTISASASRAMSAGGAPGSSPTTIRSKATFGAFRWSRTRLEGSLTPSRSHHCAAFAGARSGSPESQAA